VSCFHTYCIELLSFQSNEYCVYNKQQQRVKYIIQYTEACDESDRRNYILNRPMSMEADDPESSKSEVVPPLYTGKRNTAKHICISVS